MKMGPQWLSRNGEDTAIIEGISYDSCLRGFQADDAGQIRSGTYEIEKIIYSFFR